MAWQEYLEELKKRPVADDFILDIPLGKLSKLARGWTMVDVKIITHTDPFPDDLGEKEKFDWLWSCSSFNLKKWQMLTGFDMLFGLIFRLIFSGLIYPDGTYNEEWLKIKLFEQKRRNKNDRNSEFEGDDD